MGDWLQHLDLACEVEVPGLDGFDLLPRGGHRVEGALDLRQRAARSGFFHGVDTRFVRLVGLDHTSLLLLGGDLDQDALGDGRVLAAIVQDRLGKLVEGEGH